MDRISIAKRSRNMSKIRSSNTIPEKFLRHLLYHIGFRYRINYKQLPGKPDIYISKYSTAIFVNGCFWHRHHECKFSTTPKTNIDFWEEKFTRNIQRDSAVYENLRTRKIKVIVIWECTIKRMMKQEAFKKQILENIAEEIRVENIDFIEF